MRIGNSGRNSSSGPSPTSSVPRHAAREHPVLVAVDGVDLPVVAEMAERLRALPRRRGVRGEAAVEDGEGRGEVGRREVGVELGEAVADDERLVGDGREREAREVVPHVLLATARLGAAAGAQGAALGLGVVDPVGVHEQRLRHARQVAAGRGADAGLVDGDVAPAGELDALDGAGVGERGLGRLRGVVVVEVEEREPDAEPGGVERPPQRGLADPGEERTRERDQQPGAVTRDAVGRDRRPVADAGQAPQRELDDLTGARASGAAADAPEASATKPMPHESISARAMRSS